MSERITPAQRRAIFAAARQRGLSTDDIRGMTPAGSISMLTITQASRVLDGLNRGTTHAREGRPPRRRRQARRDKQVYQIATQAQRDKITALCWQIGFNQGALYDFLSKRHFGDGRPMTRTDSSRDASEVIELLKHVRDRKEDFANRRQRSAAHESTA